MTFEQVNAGWGSVALDLFADLITCLGLRIPLTKNFSLEQSCSNCKVTYYGKMLRHFLSKYMTTSNLLGKRIKNTKELAMSDHLLQCNCLGSDSNKFKLLIKKNLLIKSEKPVVN